MSYVVSVLTTRNSTISPTSCDVTTAAHWFSVVVAPLSTVVGVEGEREKVEGGEGAETEGHDCGKSKRREEERKDVNRKVMERKKKRRHYMK